jgi:hypothetical protein
MQRAPLVRAYDKAWQWAEIRKAQLDPAAVASAYAMNEAPRVEAFVEIVEVERQGGYAGSGGGVAQGGSAWTRLVLSFPCARTVHGGTRQALRACRLWG